MLGKVQSSPLPSQISGLQRPDFCLGELSESFPLFYLQLDFWEVEVRGVFVKSDQLAVDVGHQGSHQAQVETQERGTFLVLRSVTDNSSYIVIGKNTSEIVGLD